MNRHKKDSICLKISAVFCALTLLLDVYGLSSVITGGSGFVNFASEQGAADNEGQIITTTIGGNPQENNSDNSTDNKTVAAASDEVAIGKINNKFISPYTANTSFNNVYLKNSTDLTIDLKELLGEELLFKIEKNGEPQVLIVHSHATESFMTEDRDYYTASDTSRSTDNTKNMVAVGNALAKKLNDAGIVTLHSDTLHDYPDYNYSYTNSAKTIKEYLQKYPSIKIVLDMHRDAVGASPDKVKVTTKIGGKSAAQVMLVMGTNYENYRENLKLAVRLHQTVEIMYPGLARAISLVPYEYNQSLHTGSLLIEMGTDANTVEEVRYSAELVGDALISLCNSLS